MTSRAQRFLLGESVELEHYRKSTKQVLVEVPLVAISAVLFCVIPSLVVSTLFESRLGYLLCAPISTWVFCKLAREGWDEIGEKIVRIDPAEKVLVIKQQFPHRQELRSESIPFKDLLLLRFWRADGEGESAAFVLRVQISKNISRPDVAGYLLHLEPVAGNAIFAEEKTAELAERLVAATGLDYFDIQRSKDHRFALWSNPSVGRTSHGKPCRHSCQTLGGVKHGSP